LWGGQDVEIQFTVCMIFPCRLRTPRQLSLRPSVCVWKWLVLCSLYTSAAFAALYGNNTIHTSERISFSRLKQITTPILYHTNSNPRKTAQHIEHHSHQQYHQQHTHIHTQTHTTQLLRSSVCWLSNINLYLSWTHCLRILLHRTNKLIRHLLTLPQTGL